MENQLNFNIMYIEQAYKSRHEIWRYLLGILTVFIGWQVFGAVPLMAALFTKSNAMQILASGEMGLMSEALGSNLFLFLMLLTFAIGLACLFIWTKLVHQQPIIELTTSRKKVDWGRIFFSFILWALISIGFVFVDIQLSPDDYVFNFNLKPFLILAAVSIFLIPIQTSMEEYFLRGYMMQGIGLLAKNRWVPFFFTSILFGLMHAFNPEVEKLGYGIMVYYIGTGFFLGILTLMDEGLELPLGFHAANNLTTALLVTADWTAFQTDSLYRDISEPVLGWDIFVPVLVIYPILLLIFSKKYGWTNWKHRLFGPIQEKEEFLPSQTTGPEKDESLLEL